MMTIKDLIRFKPITIIVIFVLFGLIQFFYKSLFFKAFTFNELVLIGIYITVLVLLTTLLGYLVLKDVFELSKVVDSFKNLQPILTSNNVLKDYEKKAQKIRIVSPDLYDDLNQFYQVVFQNLKARKTYEYIISNDPAVQSKMDSLREKLSRDLKLSNKAELLLSYKTVSEFPIFIEYILYDNPNEELKGFVEFTLGQDTTNIKLNPKQAHTLNRWFDALFS